MLAKNKRKYEWRISNNLGSISDLIYFDLFFWCAFFCLFFVFFFYVFYYETPDRKLDFVYKQDPGAHTKLACAFQAKYIFSVICLEFFIDLDSRGFIPITIRYDNHKNTTAIFI